MSGVSSESRGKILTIDITDKERHVLEHENSFAWALAALVLEKPKLSVWMILIPIILVYYMMRFQRYSESRRNFAEQYLASRKRALDAAARMIRTGEIADLSELSKLSDVPESVRGEYAEFTRVLIDHYVRLLKAEGNDYPALVRSAYGNATNYLLLLNRLNKTEHRMNAALKPHMENTVDNFDDVVRQIEVQSERLRREEAEKIFTSSL